MQLSNIITIGFFLFNCIVANTQHTFSEHIKLHCDDSVIRNNLGYPTWNPATIIKSHILALLKFVKIHHFDKLYITDLQNIFMVLIP